MKLYLDSGYVNIRDIIKLNLPFNFVVGGRATGKTYTALKTVYEDGVKFMLMRRTQSQADLINKPEFSPFKSLNIDLGIDIKSTPITKYNAAFYDEDKVIGYTCALSTVSNIRGFDASDVELLIYDEFIPERHERPIKNEGSAFLNAYETINRNRELKGHKPLQVLALANANDLSNPIFLELGIVSKVEIAMRKGRDSWINDKRGIGVFFLNRSPISSKKKDTALYKLSANSEFSKMALNNDFANRDYSNVVLRPLKEYNPIVSVGEICIYRHKSNGELYVSTHTTGSPPHYTTSEIELKRFCRTYLWIWQEYMNNNMKFEEVFCEIILTKYFS